MNQLLYPQIQFPISYTRYVLPAEQIVPASISNNLRAVCACALAVQTRAKYCPPVGLGKAQSECCAVAVFRWRTAGSSEACANACVSCVPPRGAAVDRSIRGLRNGGVSRTHDRCGNGCGHPQHHQCDDPKPDKSRAD